MEISCYIAEGCSSRGELLDNLEHALTQSGLAPDGYRLMTSKEAEELGVRGSPAVLVDGIDIADAGIESGSG